MKTLLLGIVLALVLAGCMVAAGPVARVVNVYCNTMTPVERSALRERVAAATHPHRITIECNAAGGENGRT